MNLVEERHRQRFTHGTAVIGTDWAGGFYWSDSEYHGHGEFPDWEGPFASPLAACNPPASRLPGATWPPD